MLGLADALAEGTRALIAGAGLPWYVAHSGARVETMYAPQAPRSAGEVARGRNGVLEALLHVFFLNRGIVITPFHSMMLTCPATSRADVDRYLAVLGEFIEVLPR
jgi:glutamate-1-semialdehyde 2,1-aminomutase